jgi:hypothetical protein
MRSRTRFGMCLAESSPGVECRGFFLGEPPNALNPWCLRRHRARRGIRHDLLFEAFHRLMSGTNISHKRVVIKVPPMPRWTSTVSCALNASGTKRVIDMGSGTKIDHQGPPHPLPALRTGRRNCRSEECAPQSADSGLSTVWALMHIHLVSFHYRSFITSATHSHPSLVTAAANMDRSTAISAPGISR